MEENSEFHKLTVAFTTDHKDFENFEKTHNSNLPRKRKEYQNTLEEFTKRLSYFANLQYKFVRLKVSDKDRELKNEHIEAVNIVINRIQYIYIMPLSLELSRHYNRFNFKIALLSILIGGVIPYAVSGINFLINDKPIDSVDIIHNVPQHSINPTSQTMLPVPNKNSEKSTNKKKHRIIE